MGTKKTVARVAEFHGKSPEELRPLGERHLRAILGSARGRRICDCGKGHHCGDDVLSEEELEWNRRQQVLEEAAKEALAGLGHGRPDRRPAPAKERKDRIRP